MDAAGPDAASGVRGLLADRRCRRFLMARTISVFGTTMAPIALAFAVLGLGPAGEGADGAGLAGGQVTELGVVMFFRFGAQVVFTLWGGVLADRFSRQRAMVLADLAAAATHGLLAVLLIRGLADLPVLILLSFLNGIAVSLFMPAADGVLPLLVPASAIKDANAAVKTGENAARILGAAGGGALVAVFGAGWALLVDAATFGVSALLLAGLGLPAALRPQRVSVLGDLRGGLREVTSREWMWVGLLQVSVLNFCNSGGIYVLGPALAAASTHGAFGWSIALGAQTIGFLLGSVLVLRLPSRRPMRGATLWSLGWVPPFVALALGAPLWVFAVTMLVAGVSMEGLEVLSNSVSQARVPEHVLSRVGAIHIVASFALVPLGFAAVGPISAWLGTRTTLLTYALVMVVSVAAALTSRSLREITMPGRDEDAHEAADEDAALSPDPLSRTAGGSAAREERADPVRE